MRQVGFLAAAAIYALDNQVERLAEDHARAKKLGAVLASCSFIKKVEPIETNIVIFYTNDTVDEVEFVNKMIAKDIHFITMGEGKLRMVTHLDFTENMLEKLILELKSF